MDWKNFILHAQKIGLVFLAGDQHECRRGDMLLIPLRTPKDPRNIYELVKLVGAYAYPAKRAASIKQLTNRVTRCADITNPDIPRLTWHHPWQLPEDVDPTMYISLGEYLIANGYPPL